MKRKLGSPEDNTINKKQRKDIASAIFNDDSFSNCFCSVDSIANALGYFTGSVDVVWPNTEDKFAFHFTTKCCTTENQTHKTHVTFEGDWVKRTRADWEPIDTKLDKFQLSLDGVTLVKTGQKTKKLVFCDGVIFQKFRQGNPRFVNTWQMQQETPDNDPCDWFTTPARPVAEPLSVLARKMLNGRQEIATINEEDTEPITITQDSIDIQAVQIQQNEHASSTRQESHQKKESTPDCLHLKDCSVRLAQEPVAQSPAPLQASTLSAQEITTTSRPKSNKARKKERKAKRAAELAAAAAQAANGSLPKQNSAQITRQPDVVTNDEPGAGDVRSNVVNLGRIGLDKLDQDTPAGWLARLRFAEPRYTYITLKEAMETKVGHTVNIIGIVKGHRPPHQTRTGDWSTTYFLQDPSLVEDSEFYSSNDFSVTFFQKSTRKDFLPQAADGDILILRHVKIQCQRRTSGIGYSDKAQWASYSITQGRLLVDSAPDTGELVPGGVHFSPFLKVLHPEEHYCQRLGEWWKEKKQSSGQAASQVYHFDANVSESSRWRKRRLFCEAGPDVEPKGYFDCVFEALHGFQNDNGVYSLYVTDYTKNLQVAGCQASWCPVGLNDYVVKFELWDAASLQAPHFKAGTYWDVVNARMVVDKNGYAQGKLVETKFGQVFPDAEYPPLQALLQRKKNWEKESGSEVSAFSHKLLQDAKVAEYINCTVKLINIGKQSNEVYFHVTDYTPHPELSTCRYEKEWSRGLEGRILRIILQDAQAQYADTFLKGDYLAIKNLRLVHYYEEFLGTLGGTDLLVNKLSSRSQNNHLRELREREVIWEQEQNPAEEPRNRRAGPDTTNPVARINSSIKQLDDNRKETLRARLIASVIDHYPRSPNEWIRAWCSKCRKKIPNDKRACHACQDIDHEFVQHKFELVLLVMDSDGTRTELYVKERCNLLQGLQINRSKATLSELIKRFHPLLGEFNEQGCWKEEGDRSPLSLIIGQFEHPAHGTFRVLLSAED